MSDVNARTRARRRRGATLASAATAVAVLASTFAVGHAAGAAPAPAPEAIPVVSTPTTLLPEGLDDPNSVAVGADGTVYVADTAHDRIVKLTPGGSQVVLPFTEIDGVASVAVDGAGNVFAAGFTESSRTGILKLAAGASTPTAIAVSGYRVAAVAATPAGDVYAAVASTGVASGSIVKIPAVGIQTVLPFGTISPRAVTATASGDVYAVQTYPTPLVRKLPSGGSYVDLPFTGLDLGLDPRSNLSYLTGIAVDGSGNVFLTDGRHNRVLELVGGGGSQVTVPFGTLNYPAGLAVNGAGDLFVADTANWRIQKLANGAGSPTTVGFKGVASAEDLAVDALGNVFVADTNHDRILKLAVGGALTTLPFGTLANPVGIAVDTTGSVYVSDRGPGNGTGKVLKLAAGAGAPTTVPITGLVHPEGIDVNTAGDLYVGDAGTGISSAGIRIYTHTAQQSFVQSANRMTDTVQVDDDGTIYTGGQDGVYKLPGDGSPQQYGPTGSVDVNGFAFTPGGDLVVVGENLEAELPTGAAATQGLVYPNIETEFSRFPTPTALRYSGGATWENGYKETDAVAVDSSSNVYISDEERGILVTPVPHLASPPGTPVATPGNAKATLTFSASSDPGGTISYYLVTTFEDGKALNSRTVCGLASPCNVTSLTNGKTYRFRVAAVLSSASGSAEGRWSGLSAPVIPGPTPINAPTIGSVTGGNAKATVSWTAPAAGGPAITGYAVTPYLGNVAQPTKTYSSLATTQVVTGLTNGLAYRFKVAATNGVGPGPSSASFSAVVVPPLKTMTAFVQQQYTDFLGRSASASELAAGTTAATSSPKAFVAGLRTSTDNVSNVDPTTRLYFAYFKRIPDKSGLTYWIGRKRAGVSVYAISDAFAGSGEFKTTYGSLSNRAFVNLVYTNVLGRPGEASGVDFWTAQLDAKKKTRGQVMVGFSESGEYKKGKAPAVDVSVMWIDMLRAAPAQASFDSWVAALANGSKTRADLAAALLANSSYAGRFA